MATTPRSTRFPDEPFSSYFAGNTVQICPVGALTAKPYRFRARPWDLTAIDSTCPHCTAGDRITVQSSQNEILRFLGAESEAINWGWLSDKCRFGFQYINSPDRITTPLIRAEDGSMNEATWAEALDLVVARLSEIQNRWQTARRSWRSSRHQRGRLRLIQVRPRCPGHQPRRLPNG